MTRTSRAPKRRPWLRRLAWLAAVPLLAALGFAASLFVVALVAIPLPDSIEDTPAVVLDTSGQPYAQLGSEFARRDVPLSDVPQHMIDAVLAAEDSDFYSHPGVSVTSVARAAFANVISGSVDQGGSTITQQYVKVVTADDEQTLWRKVREAALAVKLERTYEKQEILELYLNTVYFGRGAYGVQAASQAYFTMDVTELDTAQSALLAGLLPAPSRYDPLVSPEAAASRYAYVLGRMVEEGWLAQADADLLLSQAPPVTVPRSVAARDDAPWFTDLVRLELERLGFGDARGLTVHTTLNLGVQRHAEQAYASVFAADGSGPVGALVATDPASGGVIAVVGGRNYAQDQLNLARSRRQPGSTFKAMALAAWVADGRSPEAQLAAPSSITISGADAGADWTVSNYGGSDLGRLSLRQATWRSSNTAYAQAAVDVGLDEVADMSNRLLGRTGEDAFSPLASLVLGTAEVSPVELAGAYTTLAAGGVRHTPHTITEITREGAVIYSAPQEGERVLDEADSAVVTDVLRGVISSGTGQGAAIGRPAAGKTGTTQDYGDAWFAGYTPQVAAVVWMGNRDDRSPLAGQETGGGIPARTWAAFMSAVHEGLEIIDFPVAEGRADESQDVTAPTPTPTPTVTPSATPTPTPDPSATPPSDTGPTPVPRPTSVPVPPDGEDDGDGEDSAAPGDTEDGAIEEDATSRPAEVEPSAPEPRATDS